MCLNDCLNVFQCQSMLKFYTKGRISADGGTSMSTNMSKQKREEFITKIKSIRSFIAKAVLKAKFQHQEVLKALWGILMGRLK